MVLRTHEGRLEVAVIRPAGRSTTALPKGHIDPGETASIAAAREVREETGLRATLGPRLGEVKYVYRFQGKTYFKVVVFFLFHHQEGEIGELDEAMKREVERAWWMPLSEAVTQLSFPGEREMARRAATLTAAQR